MAGSRTDGNVTRGVGDCDVKIEATGINSKFYSLLMEGLYLEYLHPVLFSLKAARRATLQKWKNGTLSAEQKSSFENK